ncbi:trifunctional dihydropteroate synthetase [Coccidioides posadasii str. Silveira]|uniref:Folic acid synthesis protein FOL1 n=2 Tax=Coccidioides posadasii TaxID=199306 RepID=E9DJ68_COCPS|nr:dihydropteroate synthase family protein [Coccidioides posadasii C735 delta SOWgp]EER25734.1 dihydropteroate synthase family protein [Coccidioides posadasii C735 delta SOWgp]EFW13520.1 dihydropteroate synthase [Coccidioides posadasii str. Silveira]QVM09510.1 trifunctional dihydropteroate synthetase [Coccidioides posadasii str. Silveira]|eukprot:XP_003067879.1 dihydropteroate synthase family protein [Coccidioides posadasii C735 delta SOWgp]
MRNTIPCFVVDTTVLLCSTRLSPSFSPSIGRQCVKSNTYDRFPLAHKNISTLSSKLQFADVGYSCTLTRDFDSHAYRSHGRNPLRRDYSTPAFLQRHKTIIALASRSVQTHYCSSYMSPDGAGNTANMAVSSQHRAFIALGSNMGDRVAMIEQACMEMEARGIRIMRTSSLFETAPMYVTNQDPFINGVCEVETNMHPIELLDTLQSIEIAMGRRKIVDKGPRVIDLDILLYGEEVFSNERLNIPHKLMLEREFVLRPLCQLIPESIPPSSKDSNCYQTYLDALPSSDPAPQAITPMHTNMPPLNPSNPKRHTHIMAVLNVTPDSFSDGGLHSAADASTLTQTTRYFINNGATIIDIGGESTRPSSDPTTEQDELSRTIPAIKLIRSLPEADHIAISIDTYRASVAQAAVAAGADIINDVSAGLMDPEMLPTMARLGKTVILSHMRGTPKTMTKLTDYPSGVIDGVSTELAQRIAAAEAAGVRRWRIIADPGVGFAKNQAQNLTLLRNMQSLRGFRAFSYLPWLVGTSRKGFVGRITRVEKASERGWGTGAAVTAAIAGGTDIVRVHDVKEMCQVARMADAIYRQGLNA